LYNATNSSNRVSFHLLHKRTHNRIRMVPHDTELGPVEREDLVKGYEYEKDQYLIIGPADLDKIKIESSDTLTIERFVDEREVDPIYPESPYYLAPDGAVAEEAFRVVHEAMQREKKVAISRIVLATRERPVALSVRDKGFLVTTLRPPSEVRSHEAYFEDIHAGVIEDELLGLGRQLIAQKVGPFDPAMFKDRYEEAVLELVKAKMKGEEPVIAKAPERGKVIKLMDALRQILEQGEERKPPARRRAGAAKSGAAERSGKTSGGGGG
jgi:DNA end-binding protein Ku